MTDARTMTSKEYRAARQSIAMGRDPASAPAAPDPAMPDARTMTNDEWRAARAKIARGEPVAAPAAE